MSATAQPRPGFEEANFNWNEYHATRPAYPSSLFQLVFDFHREHHGQWNLAHDVGTGSGAVASRLREAFAKVAASDPNEEYVREAKQRLVRSKGDGDKFVFRVAGAETTWLGDGSVDLVTMAMCIHWTDPQQAMATAARSLVPGGTFMALIYGRPRISGNDGVREIWEEMWDRSFEILAQERPEEMDDFVTDRAWRIEDSGLDVISVPAQLFGNVTRVKINGDPGDGFAFAPSVRYARPYSSHVTEDETVLHVDDSRDWSLLVHSPEWLMSCHAAYLAGFPGFPAAEALKFKERLIAAMDGQRTSPLAIHPVSIILATRMN